MKNKTQEKKTQSNGELFIAAREIQNEGSIESDTRATIITKKYSGRGRIYTGKTQLSQQRGWYKNPYIVVPAIIGLIGALATIIATQLH